MKQFIGIKKKNKCCPLLKCCLKSPDRIRRGERLIRSNRKATRLVVVRSGIKLILSNFIFWTLLESEKKNNISIEEIRTTRVKWKSKFFLMNPVITDNREGYEKQEFLVLFRKSNFDR